MKKLNHKLMKNNITTSDLNKVINFLKSKNPILTQNKYVKKFEENWSKWLGVKYSIFVNSGSSANLLSITYLKSIYKDGEIIVPSLTWVSDIASVIQNGFKPIFVDINMRNLSMNEEEIYKKISPKTRAVFITHAQGFNAISSKLINYLKEKNIHLIEDVCESHGATFKNKKLGTFGLISNFSFYYAHHMSTIEGGMICTNNKNIYETVRMMRSHGMTREIKDKKIKDWYIKKNPKLNKEFIFTYPSYNVRSSEINAIIGINQINNLDKNISKRNKNHKIFLDNLDKKKYFTNFDLRGSSNYAFNLILKNKNIKFVSRISKAMDEAGIEYRRGSAGGGNQLRQPYLKNIVSKNFHLKFPITEHIHFYGFYIGNYPSLKSNDIIKLCEFINSIK